MTEILSPLPASVREAIVQVDVGEQHPGLVMTKLAPSWTTGNNSGGLIKNLQQQMLSDLKRAVGTQGLGQAFNQAWAERDYLLAAIQKSDVSLVRFDAQTRSPLAAHLAKMTVGENAGLALHPIHGFPCLPSSGLKGLAHHYAAMHWLPTQKDNLSDAWATLLRIFGYAPSPWLKKLARSLCRLIEAPENTFVLPDGSCSGSVNFLDAWPKQIPGVLTDIIACHHPKYYRNARTGPGDWENPNLVSFPTVPAGKPFSFALFEGRTAQQDDVCLTAAWLDHALQLLGFGAKTHAGYGRFTPAEVSNAELIRTPIAFRPQSQAKSFSLQLTTPGFFAGSEQTAEDCLLRVPSLRGRLRTYWRMLHAGYVDPPTLLKLEAAVWGSSETASPISIALDEKTRGEVSLFKPSAYADFNAQQKSTPAGIQGKHPNQVRQGLAYITYGMSERDPARRVMLPNAQWSMEVIAYPSKFNRAIITSQQIMEQFQAALFLLGHYGSVGSKATRGFGSLQIDMDPFDLAKCHDIANELRTTLNLGNEFSKNRLDSASLNHKLDDLEIDFPWPNVWAVMDQVGFSLHAWCLGKVNDFERGKLGLPRNFGPNTEGNLKPDIDKGIRGRHSSPVQVHLDKTSGGYKVRIAFLPSPRLPNLDESTKFLEGIRDFLRTQLEARSNLEFKKLPYRTATPTSQPTAPQPKWTLNPNQQVKAVLLEKKTRKGGWRVKVEKSDITGFIQNTNQVPGEKQAGDVIEVVVVNAANENVAFKIPTAKDQQKAKGPGKNPKGARK